VKVKILVDMNIPLRYASLLTEEGFVVVRWTDVGEANASDTEIMEYARENDFVVLTCDLDFGAILSTTQERKPSVALVRASVIHADRAVDLIQTALLQYADDLNKGAILSIEMKSARIRLLPL